MFIWLCCSVLCNKHVVDFALSPGVAKRGGRTPVLHLHCLRQCLQCAFLRMLLHTTYPLYVHFMQRFLSCVASSAGRRTNEKTRPRACAHVAQPSMHFESLRIQTCLTNREHTCKRAVALAACQGKPFKSCGCGTGWVTGTHWSFPPSFGKHCVKPEA